VVQKAPSIGQPIAAPWIFYNKKYRLKRTKALIVRGKGFFCWEITFFKEMSNPLQTKSESEVMPMIK
jgi:hypothetical protein